MLLFNRWLEEFLFHVSRKIRIFLKSTKMSHQETEKKITSVKGRIEELQISQQCKFDELGEHQKKILEDIIQKMIAYFKSDDTKKQFCKWSCSEAPRAKATWPETKSEVLKCVSERVQQFVQSWEDEEHEFARAQVSLIQYCYEKYSVMEEEIRQVEDILINKDDADVPQKEDLTPIKPREKFGKGTSEIAPVWLRQGLASVVVGSSFRSIFKKAFHSKRNQTKQESYKGDPCAYMSRRSRKCLDVIATQDHLLPFINQQLEDAVQFLKQIKDKIPQLLEGDRQLYQQLLKDDRTKIQIREMYEPLDRQVESLTRELTVFNLREIRKSDFTKNELKWDGCYQSIVGSGSFSTVYKGALTRKGQPEIEVAVKVYKHPLTTNNVWHFVDEERALRFVLNCKKNS